MDRPAGLVAAQTREAKAFGHNALPGKGRVTVEQNAHDLGAIHIPLLVLLGAHFAQNDGVHSFKVRGVRRQ